jgi:hypothetical protein
MFVQYCNKANIVKVESPAANSIMMLHELGHSGSKVASFVCYQGSYIRQRYQFIYDRLDFSRPTPPGFTMELDNEMDDSVRAVNMMEASSRILDVSEVVAASVCIFNQPKYFQDFIEHHGTIRTAGNPIVAEGYGTVGKLQNCLLTTALQKNLISVSHVCRDLNAFFVTDS